jgi:hypothetical protein
MNFDALCFRDGNAYFSFHRSEADLAGFKLIRAGSQEQE